MYLIVSEKYVFSGIFNCPLSYLQSLVNRSIRLTNHLNVTRNPFNALTTM